MVWLVSLPSQVYGSLGAADLSGFYCHQTLKRQVGRTCSKEWHPA